MTIDEAKARLRAWLYMGRFAEDDRMAIELLTTDHDALRTELVAVLRESVGQGCYVDVDAQGRQTLDSLALSTYADQLRRLAELGEVEIVRDRGRCVVARWKV